jgi:hypothetical protein
MRRFKVRSYDENGVPINPAGEDETLPTVDAESCLDAAQKVIGLNLTSETRAAMYKRAEVWLFGRPDEKAFFYELND